MKSDRQICVLYVTATCNLKCTYCYIDKSPALVKIDKILNDSYEGDYYFNFMKEMFDQYQLSRIEFWGGEPSYGVYRALPTVEKALDFFPNLNNFFMSTNLTTPTCVDDLINLFKISEKHPERQFIFELQLSIDGPTEINDMNRGKYTTEKFTKNFMSLLLKSRDFLTAHPNVTIEAHFKPTLDGASIMKLQTKESIIEYFQFLDKYKEIADKLYTPNFEFSPSLPNTATPSPHTTEEGRAFANFCHLLNIINEENKTKHYFYYYNEIMPFRRIQGGYDYNDTKTVGGCGACGTGSVILGLLPNKMISGCHNGFVELLADYKEHMPTEEESVLDVNLFSNYSNKNNLIFTQEEYEKYERQMKPYQCYESRFQLTELSSIIRQMAYAHQIDEKYLDPKEAIRGARFIGFVTANCMRDNIGVTSSKYLFQLGFIRLFLNGAREEILKLNETNIPRTE